MSGGEPSTGLQEHLGAVPLVDHHVHGAFRHDCSRAEFEVCLNEGSPEPIPRWMTQFDSQLGFAIRRWCAPLLDLEPHSPADEYWQRRTALGTAEVTGRFLRAAGVSDWVVDTGFGSDSILDLAEIAAVSGGRSHEIIRLESVAEQLANSGVEAHEYPDRFRSLLAEVTQHAVGIKTVLAYRSGFDINLNRPDDRQVIEAAGRWLDSAGTHPRLTDPILLAFGIHAGIDCGLPLQFHVAFGDRDLDLHRTNPLLLLDFLRQPAVASVPIMLLHCYPYHREAGYLAQAFSNVYFDVGLSLNYLGVRSVELVGETLELAPFAKQLYSSDAWGPPELHYLGAILWRRAMLKTLGRWVNDGDWAPVDANRVVDMIAQQNAQRAYKLS